MSALDTNVLVRFVLRDDPRQSSRVLARFRLARDRGERIWIPFVVVLELCWVLRANYGRNREAILDALRNLMSLSVLEFEKRDVLRRLVSRNESYPLDLSDRLIGLDAAEGDRGPVLTFDRKAARSDLFEAL